VYNQLELTQQMYAIMYRAKEKGLIIDPIDPEQHQNKSHINVSHFLFFFFQYE